MLNSTQGVTFSFTVSTHPNIFHARYAKNYSLVFSDKFFVDSWFCGSIAGLLCFRCGARVRGQFHTTAGFLRVAVVNVRFYESGEGVTH